MIRLYYASGSPFAWRVHLSLEEKGVEYEPVLLSFQDGDLSKPEHLARSPHGKVPALEDGALTLYESGAIVDYLDDRYPTPSLLPADPGERAKTRIEELEATIYFTDAFGKVARQLFVSDPADRDEAVLEEGKNEAREMLRSFVERATGRGGEYVMGDSLTRADFTWLPFVELSLRVEVAGDLLGAAWPTGWLERMRARPSYDVSYPPHWRS